MKFTEFLNESTNDVVDQLYNLLKKYEFVKEGSIKKSIKDVIIDHPDEGKIVVTHEFGEIVVKVNNKQVLSFELLKKDHVDQDDADKIIDKVSK